MWMSFLILACRSQSPDLACWLDNREDGHNVSWVFKWRDGTEKKLPTEWCLIPWWWGLVGVKVHLHLTETCGKSQAGCPHILPTAPHPSRSNPKAGQKVAPCYKGWGHRLQGGRPGKKNKEWQRHWSNFTYHAFSCQKGNQYILAECATTPERGIKGSI